MEFRLGQFSIGILSLLSAIVGGIVTALLLFMGDHLSSTPSFSPMVASKNSIERLNSEIKTLYEVIELQNARQESRAASLDNEATSITTMTLKDDVEDLKRSVDEIKKLLEAQQKKEILTSPLSVESAKIDALVAGSAAVSAPVSAKKGKPFRALLRTKRSELAPLIESLKKEVPENEVQIGKVNVKMTPRMTATLVGYGFDISPKEGVAQAVSDTDETTWEWMVTPTDSGLLSLRFVLEGTLRVEDMEIPRQFYAYTQNVNVSVGILGFIQEYWQWLATTLAIPTIAAVWALLLRKPKDANAVRRPSIVDKIRGADRRRK